MVGISGSTTIGPQAMLAGQAGVAGHLTIGRGARIGAQAGIMADVPDGASMMGTPASPAKAFYRELVTLQRLAKAGRKPDKGSATD
jgi:UDP-3-O-[3-hydroxymyristoyl] glucosamine N-acyltransferase